ncbi:MAG TPA: hypothetical protein VF799_07865 [Geobacteraceae bacterium]
MRSLFIAMLSAFILFCTACAPARPTLNDIPLPSQRLFQNGYSLVPPEEPGWVITYRNPKRLLLEKQAKDPDEKMAIRALAQELPSLDSEEDFKEFAKTVLTMEDANQQAIVTQVTTSLTIQGQPCVRTDTVMEDAAAVRHSSRTDSMIIDVFGVLCRHPNNSLGILVAYSHRHYPENKDPGAAERAQKLFDGIEFSDLSVETRAVGY